MRPTAATSNVVAATTIAPVQLRFSPVNNRRHEKPDEHRHVGERDEQQAFGRAAQRAFTRASDPCDQSDNDQEHSVADSDLPKPQVPLHPAGGRECRLQKEQTKSGRGDC